VYRFFVGLLNPYAALHAVLAVVLASLWLGRRMSRRLLLLITVPWLLLLGISTPLVAYLLLGSMEWDYPPRTDWPADADAVVVLSGGLLPPDSVRPHAVLADDSLYRCLHAAEVYRHYQASHPVPLIASGGKVIAETPGPNLSELMRDFFVELGIPQDDVMIEDRSRTTHENAVETAKLLRERGLEKVILVTDAVHMWRASLCFRKAGIEVVPSACAHCATELSAPYYRYAVPSPGAVKEVDRVFHEGLGVVWYWLRGYL